MTAMPELDVATMNVADVVGLQLLAGNLATSAHLQRAPADPPQGNSGRSAGSASRASFGPTSEVANFAALFELATTPEALGSGRFDNGSFVFSSPRLARAAELLAFVVSVIANERRGSQIAQAAKTWRSIEPDVRGILTQAGGGGSITDAWAGYARLQEALHVEQAEELVRSAEGRSQLATPDAGLYADQDRELGDVYGALSTVIDESKGILQWNDRHIYRMTGAGSAGATEAQVRLVNYGRIALSWASLWKDAGTLQERLELAKRKGLLDASATLVDFISRSTTTAVDTTNAVVGLLTKSTTQLRDAVVKSSLQMVRNPQAFGDAAAAEARYARRLVQFEGFRWAGGISGGFQIVSGVLGLIRAIRDEDLRAGVGAGHSIVQGGITLGGAITGAGAATTTFLSGAATTLWATIEAIFDIAELSAWGRRQAQLAEISRILQGAARLIPAGKRMAGVADALANLDEEDESARMAMEQRLTTIGAESFATVQRGLLAIRTEVERRPVWARVMGEEARQALVRLGAYESWPADAVSPDVIGDISSLAKPIFAGLQRVSQWALAKYGEANQDDRGRERVRALEAGEEVTPP